MQERRRERTVEVLWRNCCNEGGGCWREPSCNKKPRRVLGSLADKRRRQDGGLAGDKTFTTVLLPRGRVAASNCMCVVLRIIVASLLFSSALTAVEPDRRFCSGNARRRVSGLHNRTRA